ncbi:MAG: transcriptional repressor LexA [Patescibacteria group bacterium]
MEIQITPRQKELLLIIYNFIQSDGFPPTFEQMREKLGVVSNQSIVDLLEKLKEKNLIKKGTGARDLVILPLGYKALGKPLLAAFLGATAAGAPIEAIGISGEWQTLSSVSEKIEKLNEEIFILKIYGDSMINAGIDDGDLVLVQTKKEFYTGEVVLATIGEDSTVKRFISQDKPPYVFLKPENPKYPHISFTDETKLAGKVISVLKNGYWQPVK